MTAAAPLEVQIAGVLLAALVALALGLGGMGMGIGIGSDDVPRPVADAGAAE